MKILILVLSYNQPPYDSLMRAQQNTFFKVPEENVETFFYYGSLPKSYPTKFVQWENNELQFDATDAYYLMAEKFKMALDVVCDEKFPFAWDIIFRTNSSSYVHKKRLKNFVSMFPDRKLYAGWQIHGNEGFDVCSGAGFFISRDVAEILRKEIDPTFEKEEDYYCAKILHEHGIKIIDDKSRFDVGEHLIDVPDDRYHYKLKCGLDRSVDVANFYLLHEKIK